MATKEGLLKLIKENSNPITEARKKKQEQKVKSNSIVSIAEQLQKVKSNSNASVPETETAPSVSKKNNSKLDYSGVTNYTTAVDFLKRNNQDNLANRLVNEKDYENLPESAKVGYRDYQDYLDKTIEKNMMMFNISKDQEKRDAYKYENLSSNQDFDEYKEKGKVRAGVFPGEGETFDVNKHGNKVERARDGVDLSLKYGVEQYGGEMYNFKELTNREVDNYNYLLAKEGYNSAEKYLRDLKSGVTERIGTKVADIIDRRSPFTKTALTAGMSVGRGLNQITTALDSVPAYVSASKDVAGINALDVAGEKVRDNIDSGFGRLLYDAGTNISAQLPQYIVGATFGPAAQAITMGVQSAGGDYREQILAGKDPKKARIHATGIGTLEAGLGRALNAAGGAVGWGPAKLSSKANLITNSFARGAANLGISLGSEILEEEGQLFLAPVMDMLVYGDKWKTPEVDEIVNTALVTMISTGVMSGGGVISSITGDNSALGKEVLKQFNVETEQDKSTFVNALIDEGNSHKRGSDSYNMAKTLQRKVNKGAEISEHQIGTMYAAIVRDAEIESAKKIKRESKIPSGAVDGLAKGLIDYTISEMPKNSQAYQYAVELKQKTSKITNEEFNYLVELGAEQKQSESFSNISVGDTFKDTKTGNTITVVERDAENTTVEIDTGAKTETREFTNNQADNLATNEQFEPVEISEALSPEDAQKYNIVVSNLKRKAEELGLLDNNFFTALQNVNLYNPSANDRGLISSEFHRVFAGNTDPLITGWLNAIGVDARPETGQYVGSYSGHHYTAEQEQLMARLTNEQLINAIESPIGATANVLGIKNMPLWDSLKNAGLVDDDGVLIDAFVVDERQRRFEAQRTNRTESNTVENKENAISDVVDAMEDTLLPGSKETIFASMEKAGQKGDIYVFAEKLTSYCENNGNINAFSEYFYDGGEKVTATIKSVLSAKTDNIEKASDSTFKETDVENGNAEELIEKLRKSVPKIMTEPFIFSVNSRNVKKGKNATDTIKKYFDSIGGVANNPELGEVELTKSGAKSTVFHGVGKDKITATLALKDVIEKGKIINHEANWKNRGYDTYIIAGKGTLNKKTAIIGVVIKSYPNTNMRNKFYVHEIIKIGVDTDSAGNEALTTVNVSSPTNDIISQDNDIVNNSVRKNDEVDTKTVTPGLAPSKYNVLLSLKEKMSLDKLGKKLGVEIRIVKGLNNEKAEGNYGQRVVEVSVDSDNKFIEVVAHEITHRLQELSPREYENFRDIAVEIVAEETGKSVDEVISAMQELYLERGESITRIGATDEIAANYAMRIIGDSDKLADFLRRLEKDEIGVSLTSQERKNLIQRIIEVIKEFFQKIKGEQFDPVTMATIDKTQKAIELYEKTFPKSVENVYSKDTDEDDSTSQKRHMFIGEKAKIRRDYRLSKAKAMEREGMSKEEIFKKTGWFRGADSEWRFEISDKDFIYKQPELLSQEEIERYRELFDVYCLRELSEQEEKEYRSLKKRLPGYMLEEIIDHKDLFRAYPKLKKIGVMYTYDLPENSGGGYDPIFKIIYLRATYSPEVNRYAITHEIQHAVQQIEGFSMGANDEIWERKIREGFVKTNSMTGQPMTAHDLYMNSAGEIEGRDVQKREKLTEGQRREIFPNIGDENTVFTSFQDVIRTVGTDENKGNLSRNAVSMSENVENIDTNYVANEDEGIYNDAVDKRMVYNDGNEIVLSEFEKQRVISAINTDGAYSGNKNRKIRYKYYDNSLYVYEDNGYDNYSFILKSDIKGNELFNDEVTEVIKNAVQRSNKGFRLSDVRTEIRKRIDARGRTSVENHEAVGYDDGISFRYYGQQRGNIGTDDSTKNDGNSKSDGKSVKKQYSLKTRVPGKNMLDLLKEESKYNYESLIEKPDMKVSNIKKDIPLNDKGQIDRKAIIGEAIKNVRDKNNARNTAINSFVYVKDIDKDILVGTRGLSHGLTRNAKPTAQSTLSIGDILENAIQINELNPRENSSGGYILLGIGSDIEGNYYPVRIVVNNYEVSEIETLDVLYAVNTKKKNQSPNGTELPANAVPPIKGSSTITIAELLELVKEDFSDVLPDDVLNKLKVERKDSTLSKSIKYSLKTGAPGKNMLDLLKEYGEIEPGEKPARKVEYPQKISKERVVSKFARTMVEAGVTTVDVLSEFEEKILDGTMTHEVITNKKASEYAERKIKEMGFNDTLEYWHKLSADGKVGKKELALGMTLYNQCIVNKDVKNAMRIAAELVAEATNAGQTLQACRMLKLMSPDGQLYYLEKSVQKMNQEFKEKLGKKYKDIHIDEECARAYLQAKTEEERNKAYDKLCQNIADQIPSTFKDKWDSWRYLAMLGNPRTHIRNIMGNAIFVPAIRIKNYVGTIIERSAKVKTIDRTKSFYKTKAAVEFAKKDFEKMTKVLQGENAKYAITSDIEGKRTIFKTKWLEGLRNKNFEFLEKEDMWFLKLHYVDALARIITARKLDVKTIDAKSLDIIRAYAVKEAQAATYRDANELAEALNKIQKRAEHSDKKTLKAAGILMEGVMPYKKTPLNIAKQGVNYSPVNVLAGTYKGLKRLQDGEAYSSSDVIDDFATGLTGTGLMVLGLFLAKVGVLVGADDEDKKKREFDKMVGEQSYALKVGGKSYTIDWMTPSCLPLFVGCELYGMTKDEFSFADIINATTTLTEPLLELSVFSGINNTIESAQYGETKPLYSIISNMATSYFTQALPTLGGQISRMLDQNKREYYYVDKNSNIPAPIQRFIGQATSKIPFASKLFEPSIDEWGREESYGNAFERILENTVSPGYYSEERYTEVDRELKDLYEKTGESEVLPTVQQKYYIKDKMQYHMSAEKYTEVKRIRGQKSFEIISNLLADKKIMKLQDKQTKRYYVKKYSQMSDEEKVKAIKRCYEEAGEETKEIMFEKVKRKAK